MKNLYDYQLSARHRANIELNQKNNFALVMPAGSGKTVTACNIIADRISLKKRILVLCGTEEIFDQWIAQCSELNIDYGYINPEGVIGRGKPVYICMWQSLSNILTALPEKFCKSISEIITDETHHSGSPTLENIYNHFGHATRLGLTATLYRMDNKPLGKYYTKFYEPIKQTEAIKRGFLCPPVIIIPDEYKNNVPDENEIYAQSPDEKTERRKIIKDKKIIGDMIGLYKQVFAGALCMIPCSSIAHAALVAEMYRAEGWKVEHLSGTMNKNERRAIIRHARQGKINIITTYAVGTEGLDVPNIAGVIWMRFTESLVVWIQMNTRAARKHGKKKFYILVDPVGNSIIHGRPDIDRKWSLDTEYTPGATADDVPTMKICPVCDTMNAAINEKCWICNYDFLTGTLDGLPLDKKKRRLPRFVDGELVWLDGGENNGGAENGQRRQNDCIDSGDSGCGNGDNGNIREITRAEKMEILKRDLTGLRHKTRFRDGIKWL
jgi:superfamily II DNA or RNA helicase